MSIISRTRSHPVADVDHPRASMEPDEGVETTHQRAVHVVAALIRLALGVIFAWAFLDKLFGLGRATASKDAWINGGHPTKGFLAFAAQGPFTGFYHSIAGQPVVDWLFMLGLLGIAVALLTGVALRLAAVAGGLMLVMMWSVVLPPANNPVVDDHLVDTAVLALLALLGAGRTWGLGRRWERLELVRRHHWLR